MMVAGSILIAQHHVSPLPPIQRRHKDLRKMESDAENESDDKGIVERTGLIDTIVLSHTISW